jgi:hypothetical protein
LVGVLVVVIHVLIVGWGWLSGGSSLFLGTAGRRSSRPK